MEFSSKARTLAQLQNRLRTARVLPLEILPVKQWQKQPEACLDRLIAALGADKLIVRSSAMREDADGASLAGCFESVAGVHGRDALAQAIDRVVASYGELHSELDELLVQPMLERVTLSGVAFSIDPNTGGPYRVINYAHGGDAAAVTGGCKDTLTYIHAQTAKIEAPRSLGQVVKLLEELEGLFPGHALDIEFAFEGTEDRQQLVLLQVRPLGLQAKPAATADHHAMLAAIEQKVAQGFRPHPFLHGRATVYGVMPDWNPAEIIGVRPRPLALSLYRELITDAIWAYQRHNYGYKNLRSFPLLLHFHGLPYIDVRVSFNSFIPEDIEGGLADRLVDYYIDRLLETPSLHDKVEFDIVFSCYALDLPRRLAILEERGFSRQECTQLAESLRRLTNRIIHQKSGLWRADQERLEVLAKRRDAVLAANLDPVARIYWLLEDCKRYGTLPFAGLARAGFIAVQILRSLVAEGVFTQSDFDAFMASLNTVSSQLARDMSCLDRTTFVNKYGHLRPGTYDILSPRYDEAPDLYFDWTRTVAAKASHGGNGFSLGIGQMRQISAMLGEHGLDIDVVGLFDFLQAGIEMREYSKFVFTRNLSDTLSLMRHVGGELGFSVDDMSYADVAVFYELHGASTDARTLLARSIEQGRERHAATCRLWLPPLITQATDVWGFHLPVAEPNFITQKTVIAPVVPYSDKDRLAGAIVTIPSADPGFDWLFSHPIAGLITAYGGVNSHMAIRAGELALPAVIGAGETQFAKWSAAKRLALDCANRRVQVLS